MEKVKNIALVEGLRNVVEHTPSIFTIGRGFLNGLTFGRFFCISGKSHSLTGKGVQSETQLAEFDIFYGNSGFVCSYPL